VTQRTKIALLILVVTVGLMGYYALRLKRRAEQLPVRSADTRPVAPPVSGKTEQVTLFVADDNDGLLHKQVANIALPSDPSERGQQVLRALISAYLEKNSHHLLATGADVDAVFMVKPNIAIVDTNAEFADGHRSGILVEQLTIASMAQTLAANVEGIGRVKILVQGKERETLAGHADLTIFYDLSGESWPVAP
jgi:Sporulation and spore germination